jgi:hypothetical protein
MSTELKLNIATSGYVAIREVVINVDKTLIKSLEFQVQNVARSHKKKVCSKCMVRNDDYAVTIDITTSVRFMLQQLLFYKSYSVQLNSL